jgi:hypothetical protein
MALKQLSGSTAPDGSRYMTLTDGSGNLVSSTTSTTLSVSNGVVSNDGTYITFSADDVLLSSAPFLADVLIVGGGAGGGTGAGGGAGRPQFFQNVSFGTQTPIVVGLGGAGSTGSQKSTAGGHSWVVLPTTTLVSTGGAACAITNQNGPIWLSGSGSGVSSPSSGGPSYTGGTGEGLLYENAGGNTSTIASPFAGSGGGGAGAPGGNVTVAGLAGVGGIGILCSITGSPVYYGGGGGGSCVSNGGVGCTPAAGGLGGGGAGGSGNGVNGVNGTGGGGGGAFNASTGGKGGNGVVIIKPKSTISAGTNTIQSSASAITLPITANLAGFYSVIKLSTWSGNCLQVTRSSDSTTLDIGFVNNIVDWKSADQFAGATNSSLTVSKFYDQSGSGNDLIGASLGGFTLPTFGVLNTWFGIRPVSLEGLAAANYQYLKNSTITGNTNAVTLYNVASPHTSTDYQGYWSLTDVTNLTYYSNLGSGAGTDLRMLTPSVAEFDTNFRPTAILGTISVSSSGTTGQVIRVNGGVATNSANTSSQTFAGFTVGLSKISGNVTSSIEDLFGFAIYTAAHTSTQMASVESAMTASLQLQTSFTNRVVYGGNSLITGLTSTLNQQAPWQAGFGKSTQGPVSSWEPYIMAVGGRTLATEYVIRSTYAALFDATKTANVAVISDPTNDIAGWTATSDADAQTQADTLYTGTTLPFVAYLKAAGFNKVVVPTCICRTTISTASHLEAARLEYNTQVRNGAAANGYVVSDRARSVYAPTGGFDSPAISADLTRISSGGTHPVNLGYLQGFSLPDRMAIAEV